MVNSVNNSLASSQRYEFSQAPKQNSLGERILAVVLPLLKAVKRVVTFPLRYLGSKTISLPEIVFRLPAVICKHLFQKSQNSFKEDLLGPTGYHHFSRKYLTSEEAREYIIYGCAAAGIHRNTTHWTDPLGLHQLPLGEFDVGLENGGPVLFCRTTGLKIGAYEKEDEILIVFGALYSHESQFTQEEKEKADKLKNQVMLSCAAELLGTSPALYTRADKAIDKLLQHERFRGKKITLCGQCLGASIASYVGLRQQIPTVGLNSLPLGAGLQQKIGEERLRLADKIVTHVTCDLDYLSDLPKPLAAIDCAFDLLGIRTPGNFGRRLRVQGIFDSVSDNHTHILTNLIYQWKPELLPLCLQVASPDREVFHAATEKLRNAVL